MASNPHPDNERERFPLPWEDDDAPGLSVHALTRQDMEAILAQMLDEPDDAPPLRPPSLQRATAARRRDQRALGTSGASAQAEYRRRRAVEHAAWARTRPYASPPPCWLASAACWWRRWWACLCPSACWSPCCQRGRRGGGYGSTRALKRGVAARRRRGAPRRPPAGAAGPAGLGRPARPSRARLQGQRRPRGDRPAWRVRHRCQALPRPNPPIARRPTVARRHLPGATLSATRWEADKLQARIGAPDIAVVPIAAVLGAKVPSGKSPPWASR
jgi:hypothetical protein